MDRGGCSKSVFAASRLCSDMRSAVSKTLRVPVWMVVEGHKPDSVGAGRQRGVLVATDEEHVAMSDSAYHF